MMFLDEITLRPVYLENVDTLVAVGITEAIVQIATLAKPTHEKDCLWTTECMN